MSELLDTWAKLKKQLDQTDSKVLERLVNAYGLTYEKITPEIDALIELMQAQLDAGTLTKASISKSSAYKKLIRDIEDELNDYSTWLKTEIKTASTDAAKQGLSAEKLLLITALAESLGVPVNELPRELVNNAPQDALAFLADYLNPDGVLFGRINGLSKYHADEIAAGILDLVSQGKNPRIVADWITDNYGMGLTDALRMTRTAQLYSYRQAANETQKANADVLQGVVWCAELDEATCGSCIALHGHVFPVGTICDDHHNGRCALLPWVNGMPNPIEQTGEDWFKSQPESAQKEQLGEKKWQAWQDGRFEFSQLTKDYENDVFGIMKTEASLKDLLGGEE
jgi:hypothetical protein